MTIALLTEPWEWTLNSSTQTSYLLDSTTSFYMDYKIKIEKAIDRVFYDNVDLKENYLRAQVVKFYKHGNITLGYFENEKPTTAAPTTIKPMCSLESIGEIPAELITITNTSEVEPGDIVKYTCQSGKVCPNFF